MDDLSIEQMRVVAEAAPNIELFASGPSRPQPDSPEGGDYALMDGGTNIIAEVFYRVSEDRTMPACELAEFFATFGRARILKMLDALAKARDIEQYGNCSYWCPACYADITDPKYPVHPHIDGEAEYESWGIGKVEVPTNV